MTDILFPLFLLCGWHLLVLLAGVAIGHFRPWRWRIVTQPPEGHAPPPPPLNEEDDVFARVK